MKRVVAALGGVTLLAGALVAAPYTAQASSEPSPAQTAAALSPQLKAMQRDLHLTVAQAQARIVSDAQARAASQSLRARLGSSYGGSWIGEDGKLVVGTTSSAQSTLIRSMGATAKVVTRSSSQLAATQAKLDHYVTKAGAGVHSWYVDPTTNKVVVNADTASQAESFAKLAGAGTADVRSVVTKETPRPMGDVRGGDQYSRPVTGGLVLCSVGFSVIGGFVTAGHCGAAGDSTLGVDGTAQGTYQASTFPGNDYAWVKTNSNWTPRPWVNNYSGGNVEVAGSQEAAIGAAVCRSGRTTGWRCGVIQAKNVTINYSAGAVTGMTQSNACAEGGDSGGSWISGDQAQGTTSGGTGNCTDGGTMFFQPINATLSHYGLTLVTSGNAAAGTITGPGSKCVDVDGDDTGGNGTAVQLWDCQATAADQHWTHNADQSLSTLGRCLDIVGNGTANGAQAELWDCNGVGGQKWVQQADGSLRNPQSGRCLDAPSGATANGTRLQLYDCNSTAAQKYSANGGAPIIGPGSKCVDVAADDTGVNGSAVQLWDCQSYAVDQHWYHNSNGSLETLGRCLDIVGNGTAAGAKVELWDCNGVGGQNWQQQADGSLLNPQSGKCLDSPSGATANGTQLQIWDCNGATAQKFALS